MIPKDTKWITEQLKTVSEKYHPRIDELFEKGLSLLPPEARKDMGDIQSLAFSFDGAPDDFLKIRDEWLDLVNHETQEKLDVLDAYSRMEWEKLENDPEKVMKDVEETIRIYLDRLISTALRLGRSGKDVPGMIREEDGSLSFDLEYITESALTLVDEHREFFDHQRDEEIDGLIREIVESDENLKLRISVDEINAPETIQEIQVKAVRPSSFLTTIDKISNKTFEGVFNDGRTRGVEIIKGAKSRKPIYTMVTVDFSSLENVKINSQKGLTAFDREVHDAICTLYYVGGNVFITVNMIYQTMTGKKDSHASPKQAQTISDSITKLMIAHVIIDASQEANIDKRVVRAKYDSTMINAKRVTITINGKTAEAIKILDAPILLDYALQKNQIGRFDMKLLDTPNNKNEETIILEGYLRRRILAIKGSSSLSPTILYETIYRQLDLSASSEGALRKKKVKVRDSVKKALDYFISEGFIKGYTEGDRAEKNRVVGVTIKY